MGRVSETHRRSPSSYARSSSSSSLSPVPPSPPPSKPPSRAPTPSATLNRLKTLTKPPSNSPTLAKHPSRSATPTKLPSNSLPKPSPSLPAKPTSTPPHRPPPPHLMLRYYLPDEVRTHGIAVSEMAKYYDVDCMTARRMLTDETSFGVLLGKSDKLMGQFGRNRRPREECLLAYMDGTFLDAEGCVNKYYRLLRLFTQRREMEKFLVKDPSRFGRVKRMNAKLPGRELLKERAAVLLMHQLLGLYQPLVPRESRSEKEQREKERASYKKQMEMEKKKAERKRKEAEERRKEREIRREREKEKGEWETKMKKEKKMVGKNYMNTSVPPLAMKITVSGRLTVPPMDTESASRLRKEETVRKARTPDGSVGDRNESDTIKVADNSPPTTAQRSNSKPPPPSSSSPALLKVKEKQQPPKEASPKPALKPSLEPLLKPSLKPSPKPSPRPSPQPLAATISTTTTKEPVRDPAAFVKTPATEAKLGTRATLADIAEYYEISNDECKSLVLENKLFQRLDDELNKVLEKHGKQSGPGLNLLKSYMAGEVDENTRDFLRDYYIAIKKYTDLPSSKQFLPLDPSNFLRYDHLRGSQIAFLGASDSVILFHRLLGAAKKHLARGNSITPVSSGRNSVQDIDLESEKSDKGSNMGRGSLMQKDSGGKEVLLVTGGSMAGEKSSSGKENRKDPEKPPPPDKDKDMSKDKQKDTPPVNHRKTVTGLSIVRVPKTIPQSVLDGRKKSIIELEAEQEAQEINRQKLLDMMEMNDDKMDIDTTTPGGKMDSVKDGNKRKILTSASDGSPRKVLVLGNGNLRGSDSRWRAVKSTPSLVEKENRNKETFGFVMETTMEYTPRAEPKSDTIITKVAECIPVAPRPEKKDVVMINVGEVTPVAPEPEKNIAVNIVAESAPVAEKMDFAFTTAADTAPIAPQPEKMDFAYDTAASIVPVDHPASTKVLNTIAESTPVEPAPQSTEIVMFKTTAESVPVEPKMPENSKVYNVIAETVHIPPPPATPEPEEQPPPPPERVKFTIPSKGSKGKAKHPSNRDKKIEPVGNNNLNNAERNSNNAAAYDSNGKKIHPKGYYKPPHTPSLPPISFTLFYSNCSSHPLIHKPSETKFVLTPGLNDIVNYDTLLSYIAQTFNLSKAGLQVGKVIAYVKDMWSRDYVGGEGEVVVVGDDEGLRSVFRRVEEQEIKEKGRKNEKLVVVFWAREEGEMFIGE